MRKHKSGILATVMILAGLLLIAGAAGVLVLQRIGFNADNIDTEAVLAEMESRLPDPYPGYASENGKSTLPAMVIDGKDFVGILACEKFGVKLPVMGGRWSSNPAAYRPARYLGSPANGTLILGGWNTGNSFGFLTEVEVGDGITFTDVTGRMYSYEVVAVHHADSAKTENLTEGQTALTLFMPDTNSGKTVIVRCETKK